MDSMDPLSQAHKMQYTEEFKKSATLLQESLTHYQNADEAHKKAKFKEVMDKALGIMNEVARAVLDKKGIEHEEQLNKDYNQYIAHETPQSLDQLNTDIERLKKGLK